MNNEDRWQKYTSPEPDYDPRPHLVTKKFLASVLREVAQAHPHYVSQALEQIAQKLETRNDR